MNRLGYAMAGMVLGSVMTGGVMTVSSRTPGAQDPVTQTPQYYKVLLENDDVRVLEYRLRPGEKEPLHSHPEGVIYGFNDTRILVTSQDGRVTEGVGKAGDVSWREPVTHALENVGETDVHSLAIEIKRR